MKRITHTIDATDKALGRLAVEISILLRGKDRPDYLPHKDDGAFVVVENIDKIKITGKKLTDKIYYHHTGWPGGFRQAPMEKIIKEKGMKEVLRRAVYGMLPKNKLRAKFIKRLKVK